MDIEEYVVESSPPLGVSFGVPTTSFVPRATPLIPSLVPSLPMQQSEVEGYADQRVFLGVPIPCGGKFEVPTTSVVPRLAPPLPRCSPHSQCTEWT